MKIYYLILAHKNPNQVARLVRSLNSIDSTFYVHIDSKVCLSPFLEAFENIDNASIVVLKDRQKCIWGHISIVQATLKLMSRLLNDDPTSGYVVLLSGQHYPIKSNRLILDFFERRKGTIFLEGDSIPRDDWRGNGGLDRLTKFYFFCANFPRSYIILENISGFRDLINTSGTIKKLLSFLLFFRINRPRSGPTRVAPFGGSQWWALPLETVKEIRSFVEENPGYLQFHRYTFAPDEIFFHSIVLSELTKGSYDHMQGDNLLFEDWGTHDHSRPAVITRRHFPQILKSDKLFARKFDEKVDSEVLDLVDDFRAADQHSRTQ